MLPNDLRAEFRKYFTVVRATTPEMTDAAHRIRHEIYCAELGFEPVRDDARERDEFDIHAEHLLIRRAGEGAFVGCARVVLPRDADFALPVEKSGAWKAGRPLRDDSGHARVAESSRLGVVREFRRRKGEQGLPVTVSDSDFGTPDRPRFPHIPVGLYLAALAIAQERSVAELVVLTETRLANHFGHMGVHLEQVGDAVEFHRMRAPYLMRVTQTIERLSPPIRALYDDIHADVAGQRPGATLAFVAPGAGNRDAQHRPAT